MKAKYRLLTIVVTASCLLNLAGCSKKTVEESKNTNLQVSIAEDESLHGQAADEENKVSAEESKQDVISEDDSVEKIVEPGYEAVEEYLDGEWAVKSFQGVALIAKGDEIKFAKAYGYADIDENISNKLTTRFAIASNTKQFTAAAIMQLVEAGKINIDNTIDKYFPKFKYGNQITVKNLLQMRSGLVDYLNETELFMQDKESKNILNDYKDNAYFDMYVSDERWTSDIILNNLYLSELKFEPGQVYDYCNTNYYLLGLIIEQASGMSYEEYIDKNIFEPCGMTTASMQVEETDAKGHGSAESGKIVVNPKFIFSAGDIYSDVYDILRWKRMLHKGNIVSAESYKEMTTPADEEDGYGFGLIMRDGTIRHSGVIDGFNSYTEYDPETDITIILLENIDQTTAVLEAKYDGSMISGLIN